MPEERRQQRVDSACHHGPDQRRGRTHVQLRRREGRHVIDGIAARRARREPRPPPPAPAACPAPPLPPPASPPSAWQGIPGVSSPRLRGYATLPAQSAARTDTATATPTPPPGPRSAGNLSQMQTSQPGTPPTRSPTIADWHRNRAAPGPVPPATPSRCQTRPPLRNPCKSRRKHHQQRRRQPDYAYGGNSPVSNVPAIINPDHDSTNAGFRPCPVPVSANHHRPDRPHDPRQRKRAQAQQQRHRRIAGGKKLLLPVLTANIA